MSGVNKVILIGNLGSKPELKYLPNGTAVCEFRLATNESFKDKAGQKQDKTEWHRIKVWGKTGENAAQYLDKGRQVYIEGRIETRSWDDKTSGEKKYMTEIVANTIQFLGGKGGDSDDAPSGGGYSRGSGSRKKTTDGPPDDFGGPPASGGDDDIPF